MYSYLPSRFFLLVLVIVCIFPSVLIAQDRDDDSAGLSILVVPGLHIPSESFLKAGLSTEAGILYSFASLPLYMDLAGSWTSTASTGLENESTISAIAAYAGAGLKLKLFPFMDLRIGGRSGYGSASLERSDSSASQGAFCWSAGAAADVPLSSGFGLTFRGGVAANMATYFSYEIGAGLSWSPGELPKRAVRPIQTKELKPELLKAEEEEDVDEAAPKLVLAETVDYTRGALHLSDAGFATVFPVFYRFYKDNPVGSALLKNSGNRDIEELEVTVNIPRFMDMPQRQQVPVTLASKEEYVLDFSVLFNDQLLQVTEGTRVAAQINVSYQVRGKEESFSVDTTLEVANRNAMTWDDDRKAASFVTAKDPVILGFAKNVVSTVLSDSPAGVNKNLRSAMALLEALSLHGLKYVIDPTTPYAGTSENALAVDFLQFPVQTLSYGAGDCDDLSICYASTLEAVGVPAAFITIPGHIFTAFNTGVAESAIASTFPREDDLIIYKGEGWIPVETTLLNKGFIEAWKIGARQWREHASREQAELIPVQSAWEAFEPIGFDLGQRQRIDIPPETDLLRSYRQQLEIYISEAIGPEIASIQRSIDVDGPSSRYYNKLGVTYAQYQMMDKAQEWFRKAVELQPNASAYMNIGHINFIGERYMDALDNYRQAEQLAPENAKVLLAISRAHHELENYGFAVRYYEKLESSYPELAERFAYLKYRGSEGTRASDAAQLKRIVIWGEE